MREEELDKLARARMTQRPARRAVDHDAVNEPNRFVVERNHAISLQLAEGHLEPCTLARHLMHAVELEIDQLPDAHPRRAQHQQGIGPEPVWVCLERDRKSV